MTEASDAEFNRQIARINEISQVARSIWSGLMLYLAFVGLSIMTVENADFFIPTHKTSLPIIGLDIPTASFFWSAPVFGTGFYCYLHFKLIKLWDALARPDAKHGHRKLGDEVFPWLVNDFALLKRGDGATHRGPLDRISGLVTFLLVWITLPLVLVCFWIRSMPARDPLITTLIAACIATTVYVGLISWSAAKQQLAKREEPDGRGSRKLWIGAFLILLTLGVSILVTAPSRPVTLFGTAFYTLAPLDLSGVALMVRPEGWRGYNEERQRFRTDWCRRKGLGAEMCDLAGDAKTDTASAYRTRVLMEWCNHRSRKIGDCEAYFQQMDEAFTDLWKARLAQLKPAVDIRKQNLVGANLAGAFMTGFEASERIKPEPDPANPLYKKPVTLRAVDLSEAQLQGSNLEYADLRDAVLIRSEMLIANLHGAQLDGADLSFAFLEGADLTGASLASTILNNTHLQEATLSTIKLEGNLIIGANLSRAKLDSANLQGAVLATARLDHSDLSEAKLSGANLVGANLTDANLNQAVLVAANLQSAKLAGADLSGANLTGALLHGARLHCAGRIEIDQQSTGCEQLTQDQLRYAVGDNLTHLPEGLHVWTCLDEKRLDQEVLESIENGIGQYPKSAETQGPSALFIVTQSQIRQKLYCDPDSENEHMQEPHKLSTPTK